MADLDNLRTHFDQAQQLINVATKEELAEALQLACMNVAHYQNKYGKLPLDEVLDVAYADDPNDEQLQLTLDGLQVVLGLLGGVVQGFEPKATN